MQKFNWLNAYQLERMHLGIKHIPQGKHSEKRFHDHLYSELALVLNSDGVIHWAEGRSCPVTRGDVILMHPGKVHAYENAHSLEVLNILYEADKLPLPPLDGGSMRCFNTILIPLSDTTRAPEKPLLHLAGSELDEAETISLQLQTEIEGNAIGKNLRSFGLFINLLALICRMGGSVAPQKDHSAKLTATVQYLNLHFREKIDVDTLARNVNMSRRGFFRKFRELTGIPPLQYVMNKRLAAAEDLLHNSDMTIDEIAYQCGFYDSNHFNKHFKTAYGTSPGKFRRNAE